MLMQATEEAKDNVKFLNTLERHLRLLADPPADTLKAFRLIQEALLPLMEALRLVWVLSSYYSQDDTMGMLLQQIGTQIGKLLFGRISRASSQDLFTYLSTHHLWLLKFTYRQQGLMRLMRMAKVCDDYCSQASLLSSNLSLDVSHRTLIQTLTYTYYSVSYT